MWRLGQTRPAREYQGAVAVLISNTHTKTDFEDQRSPETTNQPDHVRVTRSTGTIVSGGSSHKKENTKESELQFVKQPVDIDTTVGMPITLRCEVRGKHKPKISWNKDNKPLRNSNSHVIHRKEFIRIRSVLATDEGMYTCIARNNIGMEANISANVRVSKADPLTCGQRKMFSERSRRIVGGSNATTHWPWQVLIEYPQLRSNSICGGSLIGKHWILTAAHCTHSNLYWFNAGELRVRVGVYNRSSFDLEQQLLKISRIFTHPKYQWGRSSYDIALLQLEHPAKMTDQVGTICLPKLRSMITVGTKCVVTGWGHTQLGGPHLPDLLHEVTVPIVSRSHCNRPEAYNYILPRNTLCAGYDEGGKDSCQNDSGGPLSCYEHNRWVLYGLTNTGIGCALPNKYGIYAQVSKYVAWIAETTNTSR